VPVEGNVRLELVQDRIYLRTSDSIMLLNPAGDGAEIVASTKGFAREGRLCLVFALRFTREIYAYCLVWRSDFYRESLVVFNSNWGFNSN